jgi:hypothetical protein
MHIFCYFLDCLMPHAILHAMGVFAASITYMRVIRERDNNYIFMNQGFAEKHGLREGAGCSDAACVAAQLVIAMERATLERYGGAAVRSREKACLHCNSSTMHDHY